MRTWLTAGEAAALIGVSVRRVHDLADQGSLASFRSIEHRGKPRNICRQCCVEFRARRHALLQLWQEQWTGPRKCGHHALKEKRVAARPPF